MSIAKRLIEKELEQNAQEEKLKEEQYEREWVGLTNDEIAQAMYKADAIVTGAQQFKFAKEVEAKLKEKNT